RRRCCRSVDWSFRVVEPLPPELAATDHLGLDDADAVTVRADGGAVRRARHLGVGIDDMHLGALHLPIRALDAESFEAGAFAQLADSHLGAVGRRRSQPGLLGEQHRLAGEAAVDSANDADLRRADIVLAVTPILRFVDNGLPDRTHASLPDRA